MCIDHDVLLFLFLTSTLPAHAECMRNVDRHSNVVNTFDVYGGDFIKTSGHSPDAFVQMAMHLATFRLFGEQAATYEASQVRTFLVSSVLLTSTCSKISFSYHLGCDCRSTEERKQQGLFLLNLLHLSKGWGRVQLGTKTMMQSERRS